ncbi:MAG: PilZ domain-containing protein [Endomicrobiales bacterium]
MNERRKANRWQPHRETTSTIIHAGKQDNAAVLDISMHGMKITYARPIDAGDDVYGKIVILPDIAPFFVKGKVVRVEPTGESREVSISFDKVRGHDFFEADRRAV